MKVRAPNKSDESNILHLLDEFRADCTEQLTGKKSVIDTAINRGPKIFDSLLSDEHYHISLLVDDNDSIVGIITGYLCPMLRVGGFRAEVEEFYVKKEFRGQGRAKQLMDAFFDWCTAKNVVKVNLESDNHLLRAHKFYSNYGFETKAQRFVKKLV